MADTHQGGVCLCRRIAVILSEQIEDVLRDGQLLLRIVDRQRLPVIVIFIDLETASDPAPACAPAVSILPQVFCGRGVLGS